MHHTIDVALVAPRYLAGGGDPAWITVPLHRACGWSHGHDPLMPRVILSSPDQRTVLRLDPNPSWSWWKLRHAPVGEQRAWSVSFDARTPVEIIAGLTDALTAPEPGPVSAPDPYEPLRQAGWRDAHDHDGLISPDGIARVEHVTDGAFSASFVKTMVSEDPDGPIWQAYFSRDTPAHLIAGFTRALADPSPLPRDPNRLRIPTNSRRHTRVTQARVPAIDVAFALENRVRTLADRQPHHPAPAPRTPNAPPPPRRIH
ncbi:DUF317 domain-containing protein [Streptomyces sp. NPDC056244]|uniref:DUF317 domain-containing protein n=1 Tax=Streptomyces sp. NPDC056244 TaxID=3345762 RepID=UPI0035DEBC32